jgi:hypothetical protein
VRIWGHAIPAKARLFPLGQRFRTARTESISLNSNDSVQNRGIRRPRRFAHPITPSQGIGKTATGLGRFAHPRENQIEMILEQVFEEATCDGIAQIGLRMLPPAKNELPNLFGVGLNELVMNVLHRPPASIGRIGRFARQKTFSPSQCP